MPLRDCLLKVLREYKTAKTQPFSSHPLADFIRNECRNTLVALTDDPERYTFKGSSGQGNWTDSPWIAAFDISETNSAQRGRYLVYLFREDMSGLYLSLNQGVTEFQQQYRSDAKQALRAKAADLRAQLGTVPRFPESNIDLRPSSSSNLSSFYEAGNICAKFYETTVLPEESEFIDDFRYMLGIYHNLIYNECLSIDVLHEERDDYTYEGIEDLRAARYHKKLDRNPRLSKGAKKYHGYVCQACGFDFEKIYGPIGHKYIEAHHLTPIADLAGQRVRLDPRKDFSVLCSNCHSMIHKAKNPHILEEFKQLYLRR